MKACYINGMGCVSAQKTVDNAVFLDEINTPETNIWPAIAPKYRDYIPPVASRRMAKGVKMGVVASTIALQEAECEIPDAIITGSGMGCVQKSEVFLENIIDNDEQYLTPIAFIQSTHNTVGAQIALALNCKAYNVTYVQSAVSFESALLDALVLFSEEQATTILLGGVDELGKHTSKLHQLVGHIKEEKVAADQLFQSKTKGTTYGEGAHFFTLATQMSSSSYAQIIGLDIVNTLTEEQLEARILAFLHKNEHRISDIDAVILGNNGDAEFDPYYHTLQSGLFKNTPQFGYKHLSGEYHTASAFGMWMGAKILKTQQVPSILKINKVERSAIKTILLYNEYQGKNHSFVLLKGVQ